jgi:hypothetical protein
MFNKWTEQETEQLSVWQEQTRRPHFGEIAQIEVPFYEVEKPEDYVSYMDIEVVFSVQTHIYLWRKADLLEWHQEKVKTAKQTDQSDETSDSTPLPAVAATRFQPLVWRLRAYLPPPQPLSDRSTSSSRRGTSNADTESNDAPQIQFVLTKI